MEEKVVEPVVEMVVVDYVVVVKVAIVDRRRLHPEAKEWRRCRSNLDLVVVVSRDLLDGQSCIAAEWTNQDVGHL